MIKNQDQFKVALILYLIWFIGQVGLSKIELAKITVYRATNEA